MAYFTHVERAKCVLQFEQSHSTTLVQLWFRTNYVKETPTRKSIYKWHTFLLKLAEFVLNNSADEVTRLGRVLVRHVSIVSRNYPVWHP
jgi:hypothetical protein